VLAKLYANRWIHYHHCFWYARWIRYSFSAPKNFVRLCNSTELIEIINEARLSSHQPWEQELIERTIKYIIGEKTSGISVYNADTRDVFDPGHALAVIAGTISQEDFRVARGKKRKSHCSKSSLIIPVSCLSESTSYKFTPAGNLNFHPASERHFDLSVSDPVELAKSILNGISQGSIAWSFMGNSKKMQGSYRFQALIAYSHCLTIFGEIDHIKPPSKWINGKDLNASEQIETLKHLTDSASFYSSTDIS